MEYNEAAKRGQELEAENSAATEEVVTETVTESSPTVTVEETGKGVKPAKK